MTVLSNPKRGRATAHFVATGNVALADLNADNETVTAFDITDVKWSGSWTVVRNGNTVFALTGSGEFDLAGSGMAIGIANDQTAVCTLTTGTGTLLLGLSKKSTLA